MLPSRSLHLHLLLHRSATPVPGAVAAVVVAAVAAAAAAVAAAVHRHRCSTRYFRRAGARRRRPWDSSSSCPWPRRPSSRGGEWSRSWRPGVRPDGRGLPGKGGTPHPGTSGRRKRKNEVGARRRCGLRSSHRVVENWRSCPLRLCQDGSSSSPKRSFNLQTSSRDLVKSPDSASSFISRFCSSASFFLLAFSLSPFFLWRQESRQREQERRREQTADDTPIVSCRSRNELAPMDRGLELDQT